MADVKDDIAAYERMRAELESKAMGKWALLHDLELIGIYDSFEGAAEDAVRRFGRGPYLIRQVGAPPVTLPASVTKKVPPIPYEFLGCRVSSFAREAFFASSSEGTSKKTAKSTQT